MNLIYKATSIFLLFFVTLSMLQAQVSGTVFDSESGKPMAFVSVVESGSNNGTTTNLEGLFSLRLKQGESIQFSFVGYEAQTVQVKPNQVLEVRLKPAINQLNEVVILPGVNPAELLMQKVVDNSEKHNPEKYDGFKHKSFNKFVITLVQDSLELFTESDDTSSNKVADFFENNHLFITESLTERVFRYPDYSNEVVLANNMSGFKSPAFAWLPTDLQPFSFYENRVVLGAEEYENPISKNSWKRYLFILEDTLYRGEDSLFVVSYQPKPKKKFNSLEGLLTINAKDFALVNVIAQGVVDSSEVLRIQQAYDYHDAAGKWFPQELNFEMTSSEIGLYIYGSSKIREVDLNTVLKRSDFSSLSVEIDEQATAYDDQYWDSIRLDSLTLKEMNTYGTIDSIGEEFKFDRKMYILQALATGNVPIKFIDLRLNQMLAFNLNEGTRLGLAPYTNDRLSKYFSVGGYGVYGFRDHNWKWGAQGEIKFRNRSESRLGGGYKEDILTPGVYRNLESQNSLIFDTYKNLFTTWQNKIKEWEVHYQTRFLRHSLLEFKYAQRSTEYTDGYAFETSNIAGEKSRINAYNGTYYGLRWRFSKNEPRVAMLGSVFSVPGSKPVVWLDYTYGELDFMEDGFHRFFLNARKRWKTRRLLYRSVYLSAGYNNNNAPITEQFYPTAGYDTRFRLYAVETFQTMKIFEFANTVMAQGFAEFDVYKLYISEGFQPSFALTGAAAWGRYDYDISANIKSTQKDLRHGFYEVGALAKNIISGSTGTSGWGVGVFYRLGPNQFSKQQNNIVAKLSITQMF